MPTVPDFHSINEAKKPAYIRVYHDNSACVPGRDISQNERRLGKGGYPYHLLGSQGLSWARRGIGTPRDKEAYLSRLLRKIEEGSNKYPKEEGLRQLLTDVKKEYLGLALVKPAPTS
jgi:hypothetical protein